MYEALWTHCFELYCIIDTDHKPFDCMQISHNRGFDESEMEHYKYLIRGTLLESMLMLIAGMKKDLHKDFESEVRFLTFD